MMNLKRLYTALKTDIKKADSVLGMNRRNLGYVYPSNPRKYFEFANNKLLTKKTLEAAELSVPETFLSVSYFYELTEMEEKLRRLKSFVIKPSSGSGGSGIVVISDYQEGDWLSVSGKTYTFADLKKHIADIIFGVYSFGLNDTAIIEERVVQNSLISELSPQGLADIRVINYKGSNIKAMLRIATIASDGRANLHQGGVGVAIDLESGKTFSAQVHGENITHHPDTGIALLGVTIPSWDALLRLSEAAAKAIPLGYLGIDIALSESGPVILEVNARPGIEIQNICGEGMRELLCTIDAGKSI
ncbi:sugar-transfer associated ATP-grasp domain-containing protein [Sulfurimonas sp. HSL3-7]|uniref:sugar-transfer associated ATP-grasp domain-containing protein n=1 Tax=Sulfonitrofixus jiaomeiensis TaxID=3131938 RepID=UPI0031F8E89C